jgi:glycine cleavage system H protein
MVVLMMFLTFALCIAVDYWLNRRERVMTAEVAKVVRRFPASFATVPVVEGFSVPEEVHYHPGHTWAWMEGGNTVRVGMDDFARRLVGLVNRVELPKVGEWVRQGAPGFTVHRKGLNVRMVSPVEGEVVAVNRALLENPGAIHEDPYGEGWLFAVRTPDVKQAVRNLIPTNTVNAWVGAAARALRFKVTNRVGLAYQDGGEPVEDVVGELGEERWQELTREFFLT